MRSYGGLYLHAVVESLQAVETLQWENIVTVGSSLLILLTLMHSFSLLATISVRIKTYVHDPILECLVDLNDLEDSWNRFLPSVFQIQEFPYAFPYNVTLQEFFIDQCDIDVHLLKRHHHEEPDLLSANGKRSISRSPFYSSQLDVVVLEIVMSELVPDEHEEYDLTYNCVLMHISRMSNHQFLEFLSIGDPE
ncbi:hypothetical protein Tco_1391539 [Tanacetum coccineum]